MKTAIDKLRGLVVVVKDLRLRNLGHEAQTHYKFTKHERRTSERKILSVNESGAIAANGPGLAT